MHGQSAIRVTVATGALSVLLLMLATSAHAGQFTVASCQADRANFSTTAFNDFATRGMTIRRACNPEGPGIRGLVTANVTNGGTVPRGSVAMVALSAPNGTHFTTLRWAGSARRRDCRYALQLYAEGPNMSPIAIKNVRANQHCPAKARAQAAGYRSRTFNVTGSTRIVQRVICEGGGGRKSCSARGANYIRTYQAAVGVEDDQAPTATIAADTPLASGAWVSGTQPLNYDAEDNVGVRAARLVSGDQASAPDQRSCTMATSDGAFANAVPCPNGIGHIDVDTRRFSDGSQPVAVQVQDTAGNFGASAPVTARIDNTPPARVTVGVDGGDAWRNQNNFSLSWTNPPENDRAPIVAAEYKLCPSSGDCAQGQQAGDGIATLPIQVPGAGVWTVSLWRRDAAGNADPATASDPVTLRYDPEPPQVAFDAPSASDPTLISAPVTDKISGLADGAIEISAVGSNTWQTLDTHVDGSRLVARIDDASLPAGNYVLRATAHDQAKNESSTTTRADGQPMAVTLPLRIASSLQAGVAHTRVVKRVVRRHGKRRTVRRRVTELRPRGVIRLGRQIQITGRLTNRDGQGIGGADVQVFATSDGGAEQLVGDVHTDASGAYTYTAAGSVSRTLRFAYAGSPLILPAQSTVRLVVPAVSTLRVSRRRVLNGERVMFSGQVKSTPIPAGGKLIQLEVLLSGGWQTFRTARTDQDGRWALPYKFARTRGVQWYRFRVELPREAGYPFGAGASKSLRVRVRGRS
ncbi:MAG TPA: carboxypeptidase-like regulatory domain-containing protein [Solirubrobacteraceae bacterium]|nr:carboxypeptidase-like regulatory domain-containing protein [Solirubrobacteraceae bacterium]